MRKKPVLFMLVFTGIILFLILLMQPYFILKYEPYLAILLPKGSIAVEERNLLFILQALMLFVIVPVYIMTFIFSWKYRADNPKGKYDPDLIDSNLAEIIWWGFPFVMTAIICVLTWIKTHELDPFKPIVSDKKPLKIQAVALQWKWLFLYPEEKIATLNYLQIPKETPIHFEITADAPMNSLWIPDLGGQIYAMPKMRTELHLIADRIGDFRGSSANISGEGFAHMHFITRSTSDEDYQKWLEDAQNSSKSLSIKAYEELAKPGISEPEIYQLPDTGLFDHILMKYMHPQSHE